MIRNALALFVATLTFAWVALYATATKFDDEPYVALAIASFVFAAYCGLSTRRVGSSRKDGNVPLAVATALASLIFIAPCRTRRHFESMPNFEANLQALALAHPTPLGI